MGTVVISVDAELGWGFHDLDRIPDRVESARDGWTRLVQLLETYGLPATWAVVGHLLEADCDGTHGDHPLGPEWFGRERGEWRDRPDLRFDEGLVEEIADSRPAHEIACHSYSHVQFGNPETDRETARAELERARAAATRRGIDLSSFVFPRNSIGHREALAEAGFDCYRGVGLPTGNRRRKIADATFGTPTPRIVHPLVDDHGLVNIPASLHLFSFEGIVRTLLEPAFGDPVVAHVEAGIEAVAGSDGVFHVWLHPNSLQTEQDIDRIRQVCRAIASAPESVDVATMETVATRCRQQRNGGVEQPEPVVGGGR